MISNEEKERLQFDKDAYKAMFMQHYGLSETDRDAFWKAFMDFGMSDPDRKCSHSTAAHYYFQGIVEHYSLRWKDHGRKMPKDAQEWMKNHYPHLMGITDIAPCYI